MKAGAEKINSLMENSLAMNKSGFVMQVLLRSVTKDQAGNLVPGEVHAIQYQVVKVQQAYEAKSKKTERTLYFSGPPGDQVSKMLPSRFVGDSRKVLRTLLTRNMRTDIKETGYFVNFYVVRLDKKPYKPIKHMRRLAAKVIYRAYSSVHGTVESGCYYANRPSV